MLNGVCKNLAVLDRLLAVKLTVKSDNLYLIFAIGLFDRGVRAESGGVVDGKDGVEILVRLQGICGGLIALGAITISVELGDNLYLTGGRLVVGINHFLESTHTQYAGVRLFKI